MTSQAKEFIKEVQHKYGPYPSRLDDNYNIIVTYSGKEYTVAKSIILKYYEEYRTSSAPRDIVINRIICEITSILEGR